MTQPAFLFHEHLYRDRDVMQRLHDFAVTVCGAGALGANVTENLARSGFAKLRVIDFDRVEERNLSTQPYFRTDVGSFKARILANSIYRALGVPVEARTEKLSPVNVGKLLGGSSVVLDTFDNSGSRKAVKEYCTQANLPCLHVGLAAEYAEVIWNQTYRVPSPIQDDVCDYPLARNLVLLAVAVTCETLVSYVATGEQNNYSITLRDFAVRQLSYLNNPSLT